MTGLIVKSGVKNALDGYQVSEAFDDARDAKVTALSTEAARQPRSITVAPSNRLIARDYIACRN
jgi:hypothetical protein